MIKELIGNRIMIVEKSDSWRDLIVTASKSMISDGIIEERYVDSIIKNVEENGSYIVILPELAIPHARPETGAIKTGISILKIEEGVMFPDDKEVKLLFVLSAKDGDTHLEMISELTEVFMDDDIMDKLFNAKSVEDIKGAIC